MRFAREVTALVLAPFAIWLIGWSAPVVFNVVIALILALALYEFLALGQAKGYHLPKYLCIALALVTIAAFVVDGLSVELGVFLSLLVIPAWYVLGKRAVEESLPSSAIAVLGTTYIGMLGGSILRLRGDFPEGPRLIFFLVLVVWLGDAGAYYVGKKFGKHKMSPVISPKKTIEGGIGGVITSVIAGTVVHFTFLPEFPLQHVIIAALILSFAGMIGDLAESMWKRSAAVKDSGTLLPGHGGFLDRFDSVLFTAPILYVYWALIVGKFKDLNIMTG